MMTCMLSILEVYVILFRGTEIYIYIIFMNIFLLTVLRMFDLYYTIKMLMTVIYNDIFVIFYVDKIHKLHVHVFTVSISFQVTALY